VLKKVQDKDVLGFTDAIDYIKKAGRPLSLTFFQPPANAAGASGAAGGGASGATAQLGVGDHNGTPRIYLLGNASFLLLPWQGKRAV
jgi:hypothetical protein